MSTSAIQHISMLTTHGYVDPIPQLGRTDTGGQVVYVLELSKALSRLGIAVDVYTRWFDQSRERVAPVCDGVRVIRVPAGPWEFLAKEQIYDVLPELGRNMVGFIEEEGLSYDLFHGHYVDAGIVTLDVGKAFGTPTFFTAHSLGAWKRDQMGGDPEEMEKRFCFEHRIKEERRVFAGVTGQTVTTDVQREKLETLYDWRAENVESIPCGVANEIFQPLEPGERIDDPRLPERYVFCLSRIDSNKGHDLLLHAFDQVRLAVPDVKLVIGGGSASPGERELQVRATMEAIIEERSMADSVDILGYVPDDLLTVAYQGADVFVLPSLFEPFGMTTLEAMACGTPAVASQFGGIREVIDSGENGILVDPSDADAFAAAIIGLLKDPEAAKRMGVAARRIIDERYSWEAIARRHMDFYQRLL